MSHHDLKLHTQHCNAKRRGLKIWEIRLNDRDFRTGDTVTFREWDPATERYAATAAIGPCHIVGAILTKAPGLEPGFCIFQHTDPR